MPSSSMRRESTSRPSSAARPDMSTPVSDPAGPLWQYQVQKRENGYLLERMKNLEAQVLIYDERMRKAEDVAEACSTIMHDFDHLRKEVEKDPENEEFRKVAGARFASIARDIESFKNTQARVSRLAMDSHDQNDAVNIIQKRTTALESAVQNLERRPQVNNYLSEVKALSKRIEAIEAQRKRETRSVQASISMLESTCRNQATENKRLQAEVARLSGELAAQKVQASNTSVVQVPRSPLAQNENRSSSTARGSSPLRAPQRKDVRQAPPVRRSQHEAQIPQTHVQIQSTTQSTTQTEKEAECSPDLDLVTDIPVRPQGPRYVAHQSKRQKISNHVPATRSQAKVEFAEAAMKATPRPSKIVTLKLPRKDSTGESMRPIYPKPGRSAPIQAARRPDGGAKRDIIRRQGGAPARSSLRKPVSKPSRLTEEIHNAPASDVSVPSQPSRFLRPSPRKLGLPSDFSNGFHIELGPDGATARPQSSYGKPASKKLASKQPSATAMNGPASRRPGVGPSRPAAAPVKRRPPPAFETYGDYLRSAQR